MWRVMNVTDGGIEEVGVTESGVWARINPRDRVGVEPRRSSPTDPMQTVVCM